MPGRYHSEIRRYAFLKLTPIIKGTAPSALDKIQMKQQDGTTIEITTKQEMHSALINRNAQHFNQAADTPFASAPIKHIIQPLESNSTIATKLLDGDISDFGDQDIIIKDLL